MTWRNCYASNQLLAEINQRWPRRDKRSDGTRADSHHASTSDHQPNRYGVVRARDIDDDGILATKVAERIRYLGSKGFRPLRGGYVIYNRRIAGTHTGWAWRRYTGEDPHTSHIHVSFADSPRDYDLRYSWGIKYIGTSTVSSGHPHATPVLRKGDRGPAVKNLQLDLRRKGYHISADSIFGKETVDALVAFQRAKHAHDASFDVDGVAGPQTWKALHS